MTYLPLIGAVILMVVPKNDNLIRYIALLVTLANFVLSLITIIGYLLSFFNKKQQCLHDMMAETLVMKDRLL